jgi:TrmH family RNA methyltransferase
LRALLRERRTRDEEHLFVCEGPRVVAAALDAKAELSACYVDRNGGELVQTVAARAAAEGVDVRVLTAPVGNTVTPQPIFALARLERTRDVHDVDLAVVAVHTADPGNAGTLVRSAAAAGAHAVIFGAGSVDAYNPKAVRASAGACFAVRIVEDVPAVECLEALGGAGVQRLGAVARDGRPPETFDLTRPTALVLGHETRGLGDAELPLDAHVTLPMHGHESLNVAMAGTALLFEAARQRRQNRA